MNEFNLKSFMQGVFAVLLFFGVIFGFRELSSHANYVRKIERENRELKKHISELEDQTGSEQEKNMVKIYSRLVAE